MAGPHRLLGVVTDRPFAADLPGLCLGLKSAQAGHRSFNTGQSRSIRHLRVHRPLRLVGIRTRPRESTAPQSVPVAGDRWSILTLSDAPAVACAA